MAYRKMSVLAASALLLFGCSSKPEEHKANLEKLGFTDVHVSIDGGGASATVALGICTRVKLTHEPSHPGRGAMRMWTYARNDGPHTLAPPDFAGSTESPEDVNAVYLLKGKFAHCVPTVDYKQDLEKRGFKDIRVSGEGAETQATVTVGKCTIKLPRIGVKGYPTSWHTLDNGISVHDADTPKDGVTAAQVLNHPEVQRKNLC